MADLTNSQPEVESIRSQYSIYGKDILGGTHSTSEDLFMNRIGLQCKNCSKTLLYAKIDPRTERRPARKIYGPQDIRPNQDKKIGSYHSDSEVCLLNNNTFSLCQSPKYYFYLIQVENGKPKGKRRQLKEGFQKFMSNVTKEVTTEIIVSGVVNFINDSINSE